MRFRHHSLPESSLDARAGGPYLGVLSTGDGHDPSRARIRIHATRLRRDQVQAAGRVGQRRLRTIGSRRASALTRRSRLFGCAAYDSRRQIGAALCVLSDRFRSVTRGSVIDFSISDADGLRDCARHDASFSCRTASWFVYTANNLAVSMRPVASHICFLTMVTGNLNETSALSVNRSTADQQALFQVTKNT